MRIAFDLDDTLIPSHRDLFPVERPPGWLGRLFAPEWLRCGATHLLDTLVRHGCDVWVYTTSLRPPGHIRRLFRCYGVRLGGAINGDMHQNWLRQQPGHRHCSKYPPAFGIDLLVDDSEGVRMEGDQFRFHVLTVRPDDPAWSHTLLTGINRLFAMSMPLPRLMS
jgi:hypothetical protein